MLKNLRQPGYNQGTLQQRGLQKVPSMPYKRPPLNDKGSGELLEEAADRVSPMQRKSSNAVTAH
jgi:hypothetical protein